ncbi:MAG: OB-fold domain-containing protein [Betaproteobacteria bacterium]|jgi:uncharacterized OB-fold protein
MSDATPDWTRGAEALAYQRCGRCGHAWTFHRDFCPACGATDPATLPCGGRGTVYALTRVARAPSEALRALAPYTIALIDLNEGVRLMAHLEDGAVIGDRVQAGFRQFGDALVPLFSRAAPDAGS